MVYKKKISIMKSEMKKVFLFSLMFMAALFAVAQNDDEGDDEGEDGVEAPCENKWGTDSVETQKNLSMFNQYYQDKKYAESFPYWYYLFVNAPCVQKRITYSGPYIIKKALKEDVYKERFAGLVDTLLLAHDMRIQFFGEKGYVLGKKADDMAKLSPKRRAEALEIFKESINIQGVKTKYDVPKDFIYAAIKEHMKEKITLDQLLEILDIVTPIIDENIANYSQPGLSAKDSIMGLKWVDTRESITKMMLPYLDCDKIVELKQPGFEENKKNATWLKSALKLMDRGGCEAKPFYLQVSEQIFTLEPSSDAALSLAKAFGKAGDDAKSTSYYMKAADLATDNATKYDIYIKLAKANKNDGKYSTVRDYARKALAINPNSGEAYILIGDAYAASATSCGTGDLGRGGVYLVAVDKYVKARSVDPSVAADANEKIGKYSAYFPDKETAFFKGINNGDSYSVGCWIGESTTVRTTGG